MTLSLTQELLAFKHQLEMAPEQRKFDHHVIFNTFFMFKDKQLLIHGRLIIK